MDLPAVAAAVAALMQQREFAGSCTLDEVAAHLQRSGLSVGPAALREVRQASLLAVLQHCLFGGHVSSVQLSPGDASKCCRCTANEAASPRTLMR